MDESLIRQVADAVYSHLTSPKCVDGSVCYGCGLCVTLNVSGTKAIIDAGADRIDSPLGAVPKDPQIAKLIDHTLLKPQATEDDIRKLCAEAREYGFASVCVNPYWVSLCAKLLSGSGVKVCTVIGFPLGATTTETKVFEARQALERGANEFDMVINIGELKSGNWRAVYDDIRAVVAAVEPYTVKVIIETALLTDEEKVAACAISKEAGAHFVKTSTGFSKGGATVHDVALMRQVVGGQMGVKASGGIRDYETALEMVRAGATRIGASAGVAIVRGERSESAY